MQECSQLGHYLGYGPTLGFWSFLSRCRLLTWPGLIRKPQPECGTGLILLFLFSLIFLFGVLRCCWGWTKADGTGCWISSFSIATYAVDSDSGDPGFASHHFSLSKSASFVRANVGNATKGFESVEFANDDLAFDHSFHTDSHCDCQDSDQRLGDNSDTCNYNKHNWLRP